MRTLLIIMVSVLFSSKTSSTETSNNQITDTFTDTIKSISLEEKDLTVTFNRHAAIYRLSKEHPQYDEIKAKLEKAQKAKQKKLIVAIIPSMLIKEIGE